jgi:hypothetical protein
MDHRFEQKGLYGCKKKLTLILGPFSKAKTLDKITYLVNDSFDTERHKIWR